MQLEHVYGAEKYDPMSWGACIHVGNLYFGQSRDFMIRVSVPDADFRINGDANRSFISATLKYDSLCLPYGPAVVSQKVLDMRPEKQLQLEAMLLRLQMVELLSKTNDLSMVGYGVANEEKDKLYNQMEAWLAAHPKTDDSDPVYTTYRDYVNGLFQDLNGQITEVSMVLSR